MCTEEKDKNCFFFILQSGFKQIIMPNGKVINLKTCDDGCYIEVEGDMEEVTKELNQFIGHTIIYICCDSNSIMTFGYFNGAEIVKHLGYYEYKAIWIKQNPINENFKTEYIIKGSL